MGKASTPNRHDARLALADRDPRVAQQMADLLRDMGFQIEDVSARGVRFAGSGDLFESVFHSRIRATGSGFTFEATPQLPEVLAAAGASVYLPTRPEYFP